MLILIIILIIICACFLLNPSKAVSQTIEHGPKDAAGCGATVLWIIGSLMLLFVLSLLVSGAVHH